MALTEILQLTPHQIKQQLKRIEQILEKFDRFWKMFKEQRLYEYYNGSTLNTSDLELKALCFFHHNLINASLSHSPFFIHDLEDAVMFKDGALEGLVSQVTNALGQDQQVSNDVSLITSLSMLSGIGISVEEGCRKNSLSSIEIQRFLNLSASIEQTIVHDDRLNEAQTNKLLRRLSVAEKILNLNLNKALQAEKLRMKSEPIMR